MDRPRRKRRLRDDSILELSMDQLFAALAAGKPSTWNCLLAKFHEPVYRRCLRAMNGHYDAEDVAFEVFICMFENAQRFRAWDNRLEKLVFGITGKFALKWVDLSRRTPVILASRSEWPLECADPESRLDVIDVARERGIAVRQVIAAIQSDDTPQGDILRLRLLWNLDYTSIALIVGGSATSCRAAFKRSKDRLAELLGPAITRYQVDTGERCSIVMPKGDRHD